jgi:hypothetical protein
MIKNQYKKTIFKESKILNGRIIGLELIHKNQLKPSILKEFTETIRQMKASKLISIHMINPWTRL